MIKQDLFRVQIWREGYTPRERRAKDFLIDMAQEPDCPTAEFPEWKFKRELLSRSYWESVPLDELEKEIGQVVTSLIPDPGFEHYRDFALGCLHYALHVLRDRDPRWSNTISFQIANFARWPRERKAAKACA